jgi:hypothetical protein
MVYKVYKVYFEPNSGGLTLRTMTLEEVKNQIVSRGQAVDYSVNKFRSQTKTSGWDMKRRHIGLREALKSCLHALMNRQSLLQASFVQSSNAL